MAYRRAHRPLPAVQVAKARERALTWYAANKDRALERIKEATANRRAVMKERPGKITRIRVIELMGLQQGKCAVCRSALDKYHVDHIMPLALGGDNTNENLQLLCPTCNLSKSAKHPVEFMQMRGYLL
jgi:5-methylcytosine-specific restriction endonuclease McrA